MKTSSRFSSMPHSGIRDMFNRASVMKNVLNLGVGEPDFSTPEAIVDAAIDALKDGQTKYTPNAGIMPLRKAIAEKLEGENGLRDAAAENIVVTTGACEAITLALFALSDPGDEILIQDPCWPNYMGQIRMGGAVPVPVPTWEKDRFHLLPDSIEPLISSKTKGILLNSPSNPTGSVLSENELLSISEIVKKHSLFVISDEPYEKLIYDGKEHVSIGSLPDMADHTVTINSFSKSYAMTGWRVGYIASVNRLIKNTIKLHELEASCTNVPAQYGAIAALTGDQSVINDMVRQYARRRKMLVEGLNGIRGISCVPPKGTFYAFVNVKKANMDTDTFCDRLIDEAGLVVIPGNAFGEYGEGFVRMSFAVSDQTIVDGLNKLGSFMDKLPL